MNALLPAFRFPVFAFALLLLFLQCAGVAQVDLGTRVSVTAGNTRSTLDRTSNRVTSTVEVTITNVGDRAIEKPIQAPVFFTAESGNLDSLLVADAEGGLGVAPFQTFFFDLSATIPTATFAPQQSVKFTLRFTPAEGARVSFRVAPVGVVNADPIVNAGWAVLGAGRSGDCVRCKRFGRSRERRALVCVGFRRWLSAREWRAAATHFRDGGLQLRLCLR
jgi:hypothetical protein